MRLSTSLRTLALALAVSITAGPLGAFNAMAEDYVNLPPLNNYSNTNTYSGYNNTTTPYNTYSNTNAYNSGSYTHPAVSNNSYSGYGNETVSLRGRVSTVPRGTMLMVRIDQPVSSYSARLGENVSATLENDIFINDQIAIPSGSEVVGQVSNVTQASRLGKHGSVDVRFHSVKTPDGHMVPIRAHVVTSDQTGILKGDTYTKDVVKGVAIAAGGTGIGTLAGLSAGSLIGSAGAGALFGLGVGALGGMGYAVMRKGKEVVVPSGSRMSIILDQPVSVSY